MAGFSPDAFDLTPVPGARLLVVAAKFNSDIVDMLRAGALAVIEKTQAKADVVTVSGALEIPAAVVIALEAAARSGRPYDGVVALGCVIRGETYHFEIVANESSRALMELSVARALPLGNGVLTVENHVQAVERADPRHGDKGGDAAQAALGLIRLKRSLA